MAFQKTVVVIAIIILIALLTFIGYSLHRDKAIKKFPPVSADCPDFWTATNSDKGVVCVNTKGLGLGKKGRNCPIEGGHKAFYGNHWKGDTGNCRKATWANNCQVSWSGYTNDPTACQ